MTTKRSLLVGAFILAATMRPTAQPTTVTVCASGCTYNNTQLQAAMNAVAAGSTILLQEGYTYQGTFTFGVKVGAGPTAVTTMRTGVSSTGVVQASTRYTPADVRICPAGFVQDEYDCATKPGLQDMTRIAKLQPINNDTPALTNADTGTGTTTSYWEFELLEIFPNTHAGSSLVTVVNETIPMETGTSAMMPNFITFDRVVIRGDPVRGQFRGLYAEARNFTLINSHFYDVKSIGEGQTVWYNGGGPYLTQNNYACCSTEVMFTGGGGTRPEPLLTVLSSPAPTTTSVAVSGTQDDLYVEKQVALYTRSRNVSTVSAASDAVVTTTTPHGYQAGWEVDFEGLTGCSGSGDGNIGSMHPRIVSITNTTQFVIEHNCTVGAGSGGTVRVRFSEEITAIAGNVLTLSPALPLAPETGDVLGTGMEILGMTFRHNYWTHPKSWFTNPRIVPLPTGLSAVCHTTGGTLAGGTTYAYRVLARYATAQTTMADSGAAAEVSCTMPATSTGRVVFTWSAVANATEYYVYGRTPGGQTMRWSTAAATYTDTGTTGTLTSVDTSASRWQVKNTFELKVGRNVLLEYEIIEYSWLQGQSGPCLVLTGSTQVADNHSATIRDFEMRYSEIRHCGQSIQIAGTDALPLESSRSGRFNIHNNIFWDIAGPWNSNAPNVLLVSGGAPRQIPNRSPFGVTLRHNTFAMNTSNDWNYAIYMANCHRDVAGSTPGSPMPDIDIRDNIWYSGQYGFASENPAETCTWRTGRLIGSEMIGASQFAYNAIAGATNCSLYTDDGPGNVCPSVSDLETNIFAGPTNVNRMNYAVKSTSSLFNTASDLLPYGPNLTTMNTGLLITESGDNRGGGGPIITPLLFTTTTPLPTALTGQDYTATLAASGGTPPYTWSHTAGTMPVGLTFNAATATISGIPSVAVTNRALTFRVTDSGSPTPQQVTKQLFITVIRWTRRASRYNWTMEGSWVQPTAPTNPKDQVNQGDRWFDTGTSKWMQASDVPEDDTLPILWEPIGGSSGGTGGGTEARRPATFMFTAPSANYTFSVPTGAGGQFSASSDIFADLTDFVECRIFAREVSSITATLWVRYSIGNQTTTTDLGPSLVYATAEKNDNQAISPWAPIAVAARTFVRLGIWGRTTNVTDENVLQRNFGLVCR
jgi:hypothetical protein